MEDFKKWFSKDENFLALKNRDPKLYPVKATYKFYHKSFLRFPQVWEHTFYFKDRIEMEIFEFGYGLALVYTYNKITKTTVEVIGL